MNEELKNLTIQLQVSNTRVERLMNDIGIARELLKYAENCLIEELKTSDSLANKIRLELVMEDAEKAQIE